MTSLQTFNNHKSLNVRMRECLTNFNQHKSRVSMSLAHKVALNTRSPTKFWYMWCCDEIEITLDKSNIRVASIATNCQLPYQRALEPASTHTLYSNTKISALYITNALLLTYWAGNQDLALFRQACTKRRANQVGKGRGDDSTTSTLLSHQTTAIPPHLDQKHLALAQLIEGLANHLKGSFWFPLPFLLLSPGLTLLYM